MVSAPTPRPLVKSLTLALKYSLRFAYPLTKEELWYWQVGTDYPLSAIGKLPFLRFRGYYYLPGARHSISRRLSRHRSSLKLLKSLSAPLELLRRIPTISAVFLTGSLSMYNSTAKDDIDLLIITQPHTLWITRFLTVLLLKYKKLRRPADLDSHSRLIAGKVCDNIWLDASYLVIPRKNLYTAHELLQMRLLFEKSSIQSDVYFQNLWVRKYLPVAFSQIMNTLPQSSRSFPFRFHFFLLFAPLNYLFFILQYLYMLPRKTKEIISLHQAFFHPHLHSA